MIDGPINLVREALLQAAREQIARMQRTDPMSVRELSRETGWGRSKAASVIKHGLERGTIERVGDKYTIAFETMPLEWRRKNNLI